MAVGVRRAASVNDLQQLWVTRQVFLPCEPAGAPITHSGSLPETRRERWSHGEQAGGGGVLCSARINRQGTGAGRRVDFSPYALCSPTGMPCGSTTRQEQMTCKRGGSRCSPEHEERGDGHSENEHSPCAAAGVSGAPAGVTSTNERRKNTQPD